MNRQQRRALTVEERTGIRLSSLITSEFMKKLTEIKADTPDLYKLVNGLYEEYKVKWDKACDQYPIINRPYFYGFRLMKEYTDEEMKDKINNLVGIFYSHITAPKNQPYVKPENQKDK